MRSSKLISNRLVAVKHMLLSLVRGLGLLFLLVLILGLSLLPLASLLLMLPAVLPQETVLAESGKRQRSFLRSIPGRLLALLAGLIMLVALVAFAITLAEVMPLPESDYFESVLRGPIEFIAGSGIPGISGLAQAVVAEAPEVFFRHWPYIIVIVYLTDLLFLAAIGKVPLRYNVRNLIVRWRITVLTALAFTVVVGLLTALLAFVNGMNDLTDNSGVPGNVIVLSDGATDELFSTLERGNVGQIALQTVTLDPEGNLLPEPISVRNSEVDPEKLLFSPETYFVINQPIPNQSDGPPRRRFVQARGIVDPQIAAEVRGTKLLEGRWFSDGSGVGDRYEAVLGEGIAAIFGDDVGKVRLNPGDTFQLGDETFIVTGIVKSEGTTIGSEIWARWGIMKDQFNKDQYTTALLRVSDNSEESAKAMAYHLSNRYQLMKLKTQTEKEYYSNLDSTNQTFLVAILFVVAIMAIGGIFGVMNTMFAAISQRIKDIGVLRIVGYKRWQILVSFMLESLVIALVGGLIGCALGYLADGYTSNSILSGGAGGGGKFVVLKIRYGLDIFMCGLLFTMVMGRLGGLVPALSATRLKILDSLR